MNFENTVNSVNIVNISNTVDFNAMRYKTQYNDSSHVLASRETSNSIKRDNFSVMNLWNCPSWNYKLFRNFFCLEIKENDVQLTKNK